MSDVREFKTADSYRPTGDQPTAIATLAEGIAAGDRYQTLVGATGTGKTATMAWTIEQVGRPALVIAHNKTLAAQLCNEFREFFPHNSVEYFVSYYDYYQPEAYVPQADLYIEKDSSRTTTSRGCGSRRRRRSSRAATSWSSLRCPASTGSDRRRSGGSGWSSSRSARITIATRCCGS